jgi:hypothetical protein
MRHPLRLWRELGAGGFLAFQLVVGGNVLAALVHPLFLGWLLYQAAQGASFHPGGEAEGIALTVFYGAALWAGYGVSITLGFFGLLRRGLLKSAWALAFVMLHWILLSLAAWRAVFHFAYDPFGWEKTAHGLGKSSRRARMSSSATLDALFRREACTRITETFAQETFAQVPSWNHVQAGARAVSSRAASSGVSCVVSRSSRATMPTWISGSAGRTPGASATSPGGSSSRRIER